MCGIAGYFGYKNIEESIINRTLSLMRRRGPDSQKYERIYVHEQKKCYFLHTRLNIIDLDHRSDQPFHYKNKTIIYNGEIYNYFEVRDKLKQLGHTFYTASDTEVLIHALEEWSLDALNIIEGMWAFALFDHETQKLILSRDPFGEKPLYYYQPEPGEIYFGSEIKFLSALSAKRFTPNKEHVIRFLVNGYKSLYKTKEGFFKEIKEVSAASYMEITLKDYGKDIIYWYPKVENNNDMTFNDAVNTAKSLLINSVKIRLRSDIPIAFCMSGGVDSNSLISIAKKVLNYDVHGFTILNTDSRYEEQDMINTCVKELNIKHYGYPINANNFIDNMKELINYHDSPIITISFYLNWLLQKEISKQGYHISISGTAADELFSGYFDHQLMYLYDIRQEVGLLESSINNWEKDIAPTVRNPLLKSARNFINNPFQRTHAYLNNDKYASYLKKYWQEPFSEVYYRDGLLQNRLMNEIFHETTPISLHEDDLNAMYFSIENRAPFLDRKLFEFCHSIPVKFLIQDGKAKAVLRESMRGIVPDAILDNKKKIGFNAPIMDLINIDQQEIKKFFLQDSPIFEIIQKQPIKDMLNIAYLPNSDSKFLFSFLSAKIFLEEFSV